MNSVHGANGELVIWLHLCNYSSSFILLFEYSELKTKKTNKKKNDVRMFICWNELPQNPVPQYQCPYHQLIR